MIRNLFRRAATLTTRRSFSGPSGKRLYVVGDIHGRLDLLDDLLSRIAEDLRARPIAEGAATIVFLGDLIDRGPDSAGVIERISTLNNVPARALLLLGNHEEILLRVLDGEPGLAYDWLGFGGDACAESYGVSAAAMKAMSEARIAEILRAAMPPAHVAFLKEGGDTIRFGDYLLVHAGIRPGVAIEDQQPQDLRWIRQPFLSDANDHGCLVIHGHTVTDGVDRRANRVGIDTGAYRTGILTAAVVEGDTLDFIDTGPDTGSGARR